MWRKADLCLVAPKLCAEPGFVLWEPSVSERWSPHGTHPAVPGAQDMTCCHLPGLPVGERRMLVLSRDWKPWVFLPAGSSNGAKPTQQGCSVCWAPGAPSNSCPGLSQHFDPQRFGFVAGTKPWLKHLHHLLSVVETLQPFAMLLAECSQSWQQAWLIYFLTFHFHTCQ